jgi:hypothetical protein
MVWDATLLTGYLGNLRVGRFCDWPWFIAILLRCQPLLRIQLVRLERSGRIVHF